MRFLIPLMMLVVPPQDDMKKLEDADAAVRQAAFEKLRDHTRLKATLRSYRDKWFRKCKSERERALKARMGKPDADALSKQRQEALALFKQGRTRPMEKIVRRMWKAMYFDPSDVEGDEGVARAKAVTLDCDRWLRELGEKPRKDYAAEIAKTFAKADETALFKRIPSSDKGVMKANVSLGRKLSEEEYALIFMTNQYRMLMGKNALKINPKLCNAAREHSRDMKEHNFFAHNSPLPGKRTCVDRAKRHGTTCNSENLAKDANVEEAFWGWFHSLPHHKGMMGAWVQIGVGHHESYWTENF